MPFISVMAQSDTSKTNWIYSDDINQMTSDHSYYAQATTDNGKLEATMTVRYSKKDNEVLLSCPNGIFNIGVYGMFLKAKFDNSKIEKFSATKSNDGGFRTVFIHNAKSFIKKLKTAKTTFIEIELYDGGVNTFRFNTENLKWNYL